MSHAKIIERLLRAIPDPALIGGFEFDPTVVAVRFNWRGTRYRVTETLSVEEIQGSFLTGSDRAQLLEQCLKLSNT